MPETCTSPSNAVETLTAGHNGQLSGSKFGVSTLSKRTISASIHGSLVGHAKLQQGAAIKPMEG